MLPEWVGTNQIGRCRVLYGGFNPEWAAGRLERETVDMAAACLSQQYPDQTTAIVVPNWYEHQAVLDWINVEPAVKILVCSLTDPLNSTAWPDNSEQFGYTDSGIQFDFWAVACNKFFRQYQQQDLLPQQFDFLFLNYNRKPHSHRVELVKSFEQAGLIALGCTTLGGSRYTVHDLVEDYQDSGANDIIGDIGIPNDIYSLGQLSIWQRAFVNIVSETQFSSHGTFLSEKTFKPIIGLRPFVINGNPKIYTWLQQAGFDCFEDLFPVQQLIQSTDVEHSHKLIVDSVAQLRDHDLLDLYNKLLPRLIHNQKHFYAHANSQHNISDHIKSKLR
jgi:hypothetical protein